MKLNNISKFAFLGLFLAASPLYAACPKDEGAVSYEKIPVIVKDKSGDVSGFPLYYWSQNELSWSLSNNSSEYVYDQNAALDIKSMGLCLDDGERSDGLTLFLNISMAGFPGAYKSLSDKKLFLTGTGPLADDALNPITFTGSMVFKIADASKLTEGTPVYFMVASFERLEGTPTVEEENANPGPAQFWLMRSVENITSKEEFDAMQFTVEGTEFVADLDENQDEGGPEDGGPENGGPGDGGPREGEGGIGEGGGDDQFNSEVPPFIQVEANVQALSEHAGIGKNSNVLAAVSMTTVSPVDSVESDGINAKTVITDSSPSAKGKLNKFKAKKKKSPVKK